MLAGSREPKNVAVFISGNGSTLQALLELQSQFFIKLVVTNKKNALGCLKAKRFGVSSLFFSRLDSFQNLTYKLQEKKIDCLFLAGFMRILPPEFVQAWHGQIFNIHPSLLPQYPGLDAVENSFQNKDQMGATIHEVTDELDQGKKVLQLNAMDRRVSSTILLPEAFHFLRRTEQHLLREFVLRKSL